MRGSASAQVVVPLQEGGQRNTFPGLGQSEGQPGVRKDFDPEGRRLCVSLGGYVANSYCKSGEGALGGQDVFIVLFSRSFDAIGVCGDDFHVVLCNAAAHD